MQYAYTYNIRCTADILLIKTFSQIYITVYKSYCYLFLMFLIPAVLMVTLNTMVTIAVRKAYKQRKQMTCGKEERERRSTIMAVLVVCTFLVRVAKL